VTTLPRLNEGVDEEVEVFDGVVHLIDVGYSMHTDAKKSSITFDISFSLTKVQTGV
jgi:hypothetical protein